MEDTEELKVEAETPKKKRRSHGEVLVEKQRLTQEKQEKERQQGESKPVESRSNDSISIASIVASGLKPDIYMEFYECCERLKDLVLKSGVAQEEISRCINSLIKEECKRSIRK